MALTACHALLPLPCRSRTCSLDAGIHYLYPSMKVWVLFWSDLTFHLRASLMASKSFPDDSVVKNLPAVQETAVWSLQGPLEKEMETHSTHSSVQYGCERWTIKKAEHRRIDAFELWCWRRLRVPWTERRSNQSIQKGNQSWIFIGRTDAEAETPILRPPDSKNWFIGKSPDAGKDWRWDEKGMTEDEMFGWHHRLNWHEFDQALGVGEGQRGLVCCSPWGLKESDTTEELNWTDQYSGMENPVENPTFW